MRGGILVIDVYVKHKVIEECVRRCEKEYADSNMLYAECVKKMGEVDLGDIKKEHVEVVVKPFLYRWGMMGRVLGRRKTWEDETLDLIRRHSQVLEGFRRMDLTNTGLCSLKSEIEQIYEEFKGPLGKVGAVKVLHLICPGFFPLWDNDIAEAVSRLKCFPKEDYYRFMEEVQKFLKNHHEIFINLANKYMVSILRILDEFLWWLIRNPLSLFFE